MQATHESNSSKDTALFKKRGVFPASQNDKLGVLLLHGFTSSLACVQDIIPRLEAMNIPYEMPVLRGHNTTPDDLIGVKAQDWYEDALKALGVLCDRVDHVVIIGLSMGGLVALNLCALAHPYHDKICACVTWAAALGFVNKLAWLSKPLSVFVKTWSGQDSFRDDECRKKNQNYKTFPTKAFVELYDYAAKTRLLLADVKVPLCIIHSKLDQVVPYASSRMLFEKAGSSYCEHYSLQKSGHELGQDCEADKVFDITCDFIDRIRNGKSEK
ncbi:MAG: alpha/beta fold hydrolase [Proteobacteria bacterium]|nr:alpha/beta fold hydrolase [Pseudomonadota bacterium]